MKIFKQINSNNPTLLLVFAGWSASPELFRHLEAEKEADVWICYDYRDLAFHEDLTSYTSIRIIAWSLGVWVASSVFKKETDKPTEAIAINGTPCPVDDTNGIPEAIFLGTLENVTPDGMHRFNRRMCGSREILQQYEKTPSRPSEELREELQFLYQSIKASEDVTDSIHWTMAVISSGDRIFPAGNLRNFWHKRCPVREIDTFHYPFYQWKHWNEIWKQ